MFIPIAFFGVALGLIMLLSKKSQAAEAPIATEEEAMPEPMPEPMPEAQAFVTPAGPPSDREQLLAAIADRENQAKTAAAEAALARSEAAKAASDREGAAREASERAAAAEADARARMDAERQGRDEAIARANAELVEVQKARDEASAALAEARSAAASASASPDPAAAAAAQQAIADAQAAKIAADNIAKNAADAVAAAKAEAVESAKREAEARGMAESARLAKEQAGIAADKAKKEAAAQTAARDALAKQAAVNQQREQAAAAQLKKEGEARALANTLEEKRQAVAKGFAIGIEKARAAKPGQAQSIYVNQVAVQFKKYGIPTSAPDAKVAFWKQDVTVIANKVAAAVNAMPGPKVSAPATAPPGVKPPVSPAAIPAVKPAPVPAKPPAGAPVAAQIAVDMERKRVIVANAFKMAVAKGKAKNPSVSDQTHVNAAAAHFKKNSIPLTKPDPKSTFWKQPEQTIATKAANVVNMFQPKGAPVAKKEMPGKKPAPTPIKPKATVTTAIDPTKLKLVRDSYAQAIKYTMDVYKKKYKPITDNGALLVIEKAFRVGSTIRPGTPSVPAAASLTSPSAYWANPLSTIQSSMQAALKNARNAANTGVETAYFGNPTVKARVQASAVAKAKKAGRKAPVKQDLLAALDEETKKFRAGTATKVAGDYDVSGRGIFSFGWAA